MSKSKHVIVRSVVAALAFVGLSVGIGLGASSDSTADSASAAADPRGFHW